MSRRTRGRCQVDPGPPHPCRSDPVPVSLVADGDADSASDAPRRLVLCPTHRQELLEIGVRAFVEKHGLAGREAADWVPPEEEERLRFLPPQVLEGLANARGLGGAGGDYAWREEFAHLRETVIELDRMELTDKQLIAVSLVFYGGVKRIRAARAMKISNQALGEHLKAALRKIEENLRG